MRTPEEVPGGHTGTPEDLLRACSLEEVQMASIPPTCHKLSQQSTLTDIIRYSRYLNKIDFLHYTAFGRL